MGTLVGSEGGCELVIVLTKPFYATVRTPMVGRRKWHLRLRFYGLSYRRWPEMTLRRSPKCGRCGVVLGWAEHACG